MAGNTDLVRDPIVDTVLYAQEKHISRLIWAAPLSEDVKDIHNYKHFPVINNGRVVRYLHKAGFYGLYCLGYKKVDNHLITALIERWRPETSTFHFPVGELTMTLQDIEILGGVRVNGLPLINSEKGMTSAVRKSWVNDLLGPPDDDTFSRDGLITFKWLENRFNPDSVSPDSSDDRVMRVARACILRILGSMYLQDSQGSGVLPHYLPFLSDLDKCGQYSWGSAILAYLYRSLCQAATVDVNGKTKKGVNGAVSLLQYWAWSRFKLMIPNDQLPPEEEPPEGYPRYPYGRRFANCRIKYDKGGPFHSLRMYRDQFDQMSMGQVIWEPYRDLANSTKCSMASRDIWRAHVPLICMHIVEWHNPDRVLRQFGMRQRIPRDAFHPGNLRDLSRQGRGGYDWVTHHADFVDLWNAWDVRVDSGEVHNGIQTISSDYMAWYHRITRRWIGRTIVNPPSRGMHPTAGRMEVLVRHVERQYKQAVQLGDIVGKEQCLQTFALIGMTPPEVDQDEVPHQQISNVPYQQISNVPHQQISNVPHQQISNVPHHQPLDDPQDQPSDVPNPQRASYFPVLWTTGQQTPKREQI